MSNLALGWLNDEVLYDFTSILKEDYDQMRKISFLIFLAISLILSSCSYSAPVIQSRIVNVLRVPDSRVIAVLVERTTLKQPEGLAAFPDGGKPKILEI